MGGRRSGLWLAVALASFAVTCSSWEDHETVGAADGQLSAEEAACVAAGKVSVCHVPKGDPDNAHTICVGAPALKAHLKHGDVEGACSPPTATLGLRFEPFSADPLWVNVWTPIPDANGVQVYVEDELGDLVTSDTGRAVTLDFGAKPNPASALFPAAPLQANTIQGVATFTGVSITQEADGYTLVAAANGLTPATSGLINVVDNNAPGFFWISVADTVTATSAQGGRSTVTLTWVEPGDDDVMGQPRGRVTSYDLRSSKTPITNQLEFDAATAHTAPTPVEGGETISVAVAQLDPNQTYYFAVQATDSNSNKSAIAAVTTMTPNCHAGDWLDPATETCQLGPQ